MKWLAIFRGTVFLPMLIGPCLIPAVASFPPGSLRTLLIHHLRPSVWNGLTWSDYNFAAVLMVVGLDIGLLYHSRQDRTKLTNSLMTLVSVAIVMFVCGVVFENVNTRNLNDLRVVGFIQRLAMCYLIVGIVYITLPSWVRYASVIAIVAGYWLLLSQASFRDARIGDLTFDGNFAAYLDHRFLLGRLFYGKWDPNGLLTTIPAVASCLVGSTCGDLLRSQIDANWKTVILMAGGLIAINIASILESIVPINRSLWTPSFLLVTSGLATLTLGACVFLASASRLSWESHTFAPSDQKFLCCSLLGQLVHIRLPTGCVCGVNLSIYLGAMGPFFQAFLEVALVYVLLLAYDRCQAATFRGCSIDC